MSHNESTTTEDVETQDEERLKNNFREIGRRIGILFEANSYLERIGCLPSEPEVGTIRHFLQQFGELAGPEGEGLAVPNGFIELMQREYQQANEGFFRGIRLSCREKGIVENRDCRINHADVGSNSSPGGSTEKEEGLRQEALRLWDQEDSRHREERWAKQREALLMSTRGGSEDCCEDV